MRVFDVWAPLKIIFSYEKKASHNTSTELFCFPEDNPYSGGTSASASAIYCSVSSAPIASKAPNGPGVYDMSGTFLK
jgi:hypothetical protein